MPDLFHYWGTDLAVSAIGDVLAADGLEEGKQRVLRRLLTNLTDYIWQLTYGAGLPSYIGRTLEYGELTWLVRAQMYLEPSVARTPEPAVAFAEIANGLSVQITYTDDETGESVPLYFDVTP